MNAFGEDVRDFDVPINLARALGNVNFEEGSEDGWAGIPMSSQRSLEDEAFHVGDRELSLSRIADGLAHVGHAFDHDVLDRPFLAEA